MQNMTTKNEKGSKRKEFSRWGVAHLKKTKHH